jgi:hypothetical protein
MSSRQTLLDFETREITLLEILARHRSSISLYSKLGPNRATGILYGTIVLTSAAAIVFFAYSAIICSGLSFFQISVFLIFFVIFFIRVAFFNKGYVDPRELMYLSLPFIVLYYYCISVLRRTKFELLSSPISRIAVTRKQFALYLRSFNDDEKFATEEDYSFTDDPFRYAVSLGNRVAGQARIESLFADRFAGYVPTVCIGRPTEGHPVSSLGRLYVNQDAWKDVVYKLITASDIIIVRVASTPGLQWELEAALRKHMAHKVVLFFCSHNGSPFFRSELQAVANSLEIDIAKASIPDFAYFGVLRFGRELTFVPMVPNTFNPYRCLKQSIDMLVDFLLEERPYLFRSVNMARRRRRLGEFFSPWLWELQHFHSEQEPYTAGRRPNDPY